MVQNKHFSISDFFWQRASWRLIPVGAASSSRCLRTIPADLPAASCAPPWLRLLHEGLALDTAATWLVTPLPPRGASNNNTSLLDWVAQSQAAQGSLSVKQASQWGGTAGQPFREPGLSRGGCKALQALRARQERQDWRGIGRPRIFLEPP